MSRMSRALSMLLGTLLLAACGREASGPNVILISVDTLRRDALYAHEPGAMPLPNLDRFAAVAAPMPWTDVARAIHVDLGSAWVPATLDELRMLAAVLRQRG